MNANEIKQLRLRLGLTQPHFAYKIGVTPATVSRWENGHVEPSPLALEKLIKLSKKGG